MPFRLNAKNVFLTYPQCDTLPSLLGTHLETLRPASYILVVREKHQDGHYHLHALVQWVDKINVRDNRWFDHNGFHPNIQPARDVSAVRDYILKAVPEIPNDDDIWTMGSFSSNKKTDKWLAVANATSEEECIAAALEASPRDFVLQHDRITDYARKKSRRIELYQHDPNISFNVPESIIAWMTEEFRNPVGLCPWILYENHIFTDMQNRRIVLKHCCSQVPRVQGKQRGPEAWGVTFTGGECLTSRHSTTRQSTS